MGCPRKNEPLFVKYFVGDCKLKIIEILYTVIQVPVYYLHSYIISKKLVANYASIAKLKMIYIYNSKNSISQAISGLFQSMLNLTSIYFHN